MLLLTKLIRAVANLMRTCTSFLRYTHSSLHLVVLLPGNEVSLSPTTHCTYPEGLNTAVAAVEK